MLQFSKADIALGYALYDSEHTTRLGEQGAEIQARYFMRARDLIFAMEYLSKEGIDAIIAEISK